jgi:hypothetical protein
MSAAERNHELAIDLARRAIAAAERRQRESDAPDRDEVAERLRDAAGEDGRLTPEQALEAVTGERAADDPLAAVRAELAARERATNARLLGERPPDKSEPTTGKDE